MTAPIVLIALLVAIVASIATYVLWPLLHRAPAGTRDDTAAVALMVLRERRRELETALSHLPADAPERRAALAEFAAQAESELPAGDAVAPAAQAAPGLAPPRKTMAALLLALLLALPTFAMYLLSGAPQAASPEFRAAPAEPASLDELAADLRRRLAADPKAVDGWRLLGRAELARGKPEAAREAYERVLALLPEDAQARADLADAMAQAQGAVLEGRPIALIREALKLDPRNAKALALAGAYEVTQRNSPAAIAYWKTLLEVLPAESEQARQVAGFVADLEAGRPPRMAQQQPQQPRPPEQAGAVAAPPGTGASAPAPPAEAPATASAGAGALTGRVELERSIAARMRADDTLFVVARRLDDDGKPVGPPLAALRARGADLPLDFALDDRQAMSPAARLSAVPPGTQVVVIARLSRSGEAAARSGDLQGASAPVGTGTAGLRVLIDAVVD